MLLSLDVAPGGAPGRRVAHRVLPGRVLRVLAVAFGNQDTLSQPVPHWNPLDWNVGYVLDTLDNFFSGGPF